MLCSTHAVRSGAREPMGASRRGLTALPLHGTSAGGARQTSGRAAAPSPTHRLSSRNSGPRLLFQTVEATLPSSGAPGRGEEEANTELAPVVSLARVRLSASSGQDVLHALLSLWQAFPRSRSSALFGGPHPPQVPGYVAEVWQGDCPSPGTS